MLYSVCGWQEEPNVWLIITISLYIYNPNILLNILLIDRLNKGLSNSLLVAGI